MLCWEVLTRKEVKVNNSGPTLGATGKNIQHNNEAYKKCFWNLVSKMICLFQVLSWWYKKAEVLEFIHTSSENWTSLGCTFSSIILIGS